MWQTIIIQPMTNLLLWIYDILGHGPHTFGLAIILFTILIKLITWPLNSSQVKGAQAMQELQNDKEWIEIQKKYAKDKEKLAQEQMRIYKDRGINPFASCLPTLVQFPIIIGLYQSITRALSATPFDMLQLARTVYPFQNVENIIPLNSTFLWMDLGRPESIQVLGFALPTLAIIVALTCCAVIGPSATIRSSTSFGIFGNAADSAAILAFLSFVLLGSLLGIHPPVGHAMPRTQNSGQAHRSF